MNAGNQLIRIKDVSKLTTLARSTIWAKVANNEFPAPIRLSPAICVWRESEIERWINKCATTASK
jgi:prophage regulatory protein